jgi:4-hydroxy-tetrahydrodipicolinate synthase
VALNSSTKGVIPIAPTPFHPDGRVDEYSLDRMTDFFLAAGIDGITILGQLGEAPKLDHQEAITIATRIIKRAAVPIIVGVSAPGFAAMRALTRDVMERGAAGVMIAPPNTLRTDDQIVAYYRNAAEAIGADVPFVLQDYPLLFCVVMTPDVVRRIVTENPSCVMLKHEDWPGLEKITTLRGFERNASMRHISILTGNGGLFLNFEMIAAPTVQTPAMPSRRCWWMSLDYPPPAGATKRTTCSMRICHIFVTSNNRALWASRSANTC